jgi:hypothetical protein
MSEPTTPGPEDEPAAAAEQMLRDLAGLLRGAEHLTPATRAALADLMAELAGALGRGGTGPQLDHLAESAAQAARALHEQGQHGLLAAARERLEAAAARAEAKAPVATGVARRLIDVLAEIGI